MVDVVSFHTASLARRTRRVFAGFVGGRMRRTLMLSASFAVLVPSMVAAQSTETVRWNDRPTSAWTDQAPRVRIAIEGQRSAAYGTPLRVRYELSNDAYVTVVRVDGEGRMTILYPYSRNQRATARSGLVNYVRNPRLRAEFAFVMTDRLAGYVFAIASYAPLDFSAFEHRDYERIGGWSTFTAANREIATRPDEFIERFASTVLWDKDTPYDYDVDYYFPQGYPTTLNTASLCSSLYYGTSSGALGYPLWSESDWELAGYPNHYRSACGGWYNSARCFSTLSFYLYGNCAIGSVIAAAGPAAPIAELPVDSAAGPVPNEGVVRGGLFTPTPAPVIPAADGPTGTLPTSRFDQVRTADGSDLDGIMSIPARATRKMKEDKASREASASPAATSFDRSAATTGKTEKTRTADASSNAPKRVEPPAREPTKSKGVAEPRRETSKTGYGSTGRTSNTGTSTGPDRITRPTMDNKPSAGGTVASPNPPSIQGTSTTEKKKPPKN